MNKDIKDYFEKIITIDPIVGFRVFSKKSWEYQGKTYNFFNKFFSSLKEIEEYIIVNEKNKDLNIYNAINPKNDENGKKISVAGIKNIIFDIEATDKKPLTDKIYQQKLNKTIVLLEKELEKYNLHKTCIVSSGRGIHLYFTFEFKINVRHERMINQWYDEIGKKVIKFNEVEARENNDKDPIKIDLQCKDMTRILGCPGTHNTKYTEASAKRNILYIDSDKLNDSLGFIIKLKEEAKTSDKSSMMDYKKSISKSTPQKKYNKKTIWDAPEIRILLDHDDIPEGLRHTHIILPIKLLLRENNLKMHDEIADEIESVGYSRPAIDDDFDDEFYQYSSTIFRSWCFKNWDWCVDSEYKIPFSYKRRLYYNSKGKVLPMIDNYSEGLTTNKFANDWDEVIKNTKEFNKNNIETTEESLNYSKKDFEKYLEKNIETKLLKFIRENDLVEYLRYVR